MKRVRLLGIPVVPLALLLSAGVAFAQQTFTVPISTMGESGVSGSAVLTAVDGGTSISLDISGLTAGGTASAALHAGTCSTPGASAAALPALTADATGKATASGSILFRGTESVALSTVADGDHVILVHQGDRTVACGVIPMIESGGGTSVGMPRTGNPLPLLPAGGLLILALVVLRAGFALRAAR
jgi:hypothetical protein